MPYSNCALCRAIVNQSASSADVRTENKKLFESDRFVIMPCVGPFVPGHILIVSREHHPNLASMGPDCIREYNTVAEEAAKRWPFSNEGILEAEHGSVDGDKAGACVTHTHVHLIPGLAARARMFDNLLPVIHSNTRLKKLASISGPYIFTRANLTSTFVYAANGLRSQMIRRTLCEDLGRDDEDWKSFPRPDLVQQIVEKWSGR